MRNPAFKYALTMDQIDQDGPLAVQNAHGDIVVNYGVWKIEPGRLVEAGSFCEYPYLVAGNLWVCRTITDRIVTLAEIGVTQYPDGTWAHSFAVSDATSTMLVKSLIDGSIKCDRDWKNSFTIEDAP